MVPPSGYNAAVFATPLVNCAVASGTAPQFGLRHLWCLNRPRYPRGKIEKSNQQIQRDLKEFLFASYPEMQVRVEPYWVDPSRIAIFFVEQKFSLIYPQQRFHYLTHLIPTEYQERYLCETVWFELAPGEKPEELVYPDEELVASIAPHVLQCLRDAHFFETLDDHLSPSNAADQRQACSGDYRASRSILPSKGFREDEYFDIFHVLMAQGGFCDCEILYNVADRSRLAAEYWNARSEGRKPYEPHDRY